MMKNILNEFKTAYKIVGYGAKIKVNFMMAGLFLLLGIIFEFASKGTQITGSFYIVLSGMFLYQMIMSSDISTLVQASPYKKKIQCHYPMIAVIPWMFIALTIVLIIHYVFTLQDASQLQEQCQNLIVLGGCIFFMLTYFGIAYKYFIGATAFMIVSIMVMMFGANAYFRSPMAVELSFAGCVIFDYVASIAGCILCKLFTELLYKKDLSPLAFRGLIKKG